MTGPTPPPIAQELQGHQQVSRIKGRKSYSAIRPLNVPRSRSVTKSDNIICTDEVIAPAPNPCTAIGPLLDQVPHCRGNTRRTSSSNKHVHTRRSPTNGAPESKDYNCR